MQLPTAPLNAQNSKRTLITHWKYGNVKKETIIHN